MLNPWQTYYQPFSRFLQQNIWFLPSLPPSRFSSQWVLVGQRALWACLVPKRQVLIIVDWNWEEIMLQRFEVWEYSPGNFPCLLSSFFVSPLLTWPTPDGASSWRCFSPRLLSFFLCSSQTSCWWETCLGQFSLQSAAPRPMISDSVCYFSTYFLYCFLLGLPILTSVFGPHHPLEGLIYLTAPISLLVLNPIGFVLLELSREKAKGKAEGGNDKRITAVHTLLKVKIVKNALFFWNNLCRYQKDL